MGEQYINRPERLARWICKSLKPRAEVEICEVHRAIVEMERRRVHVSPSWRQQVQMEAADVSKAVQLVLSNGWLVERDGRLSISDTGAAMARRSRAGLRKKRVAF